MGRNPIDVAVGVLRDRAGRVLLARRPAGKPLAGYLEFPGGKVEDGEKPVEALARELAEETGVVVGIADLEPLIRFEHAYPGFSVRLHVYTTSCWEGDPVGAEGQALGWHEPATLAELPMLPANRPVFTALALPGLLQVTPLLDAESAPAFSQMLERAIEDRREGGILVRVTDRQALARLQTGLAPAMGGAARPVLLNLGEASDSLPGHFSGLHLPARAMSGLTGRPAVPGWVGASVHTLAEARRARELGLDYVVIGNVRPTASHPERPPLGWNRFEKIALAAGVPAYAIGGLGPDDRHLARGHWGQGVAGIRAFWPETA